MYSSILHFKDWFDLELETSRAMLVALSHMHCQTINISAVKFELTSKTLWRL